MLIKFNSNEKQTIKDWSYLFDAVKDWACLLDDKGKEIVDIKYIRSTEEEMEEQTGWRYEVTDIYQVAYEDKSTKEYLEDDEIYLSIEVEV